MKWMKSNAVPSRVDFSAQGSSLLYCETPFKMLVGQDVHCAFVVTQHEGSNCTPPASRYITVSLAHEALAVYYWTARMSSAMCIASRGILELHT